MPDQIIRDIPLIQRYSRHNEDQDYRFRAFLKTELEMPSKDLDQVVRQTTDEVWKQIDCTQCAHCCRSLQIVVDDRDVARLATRLAIDPRAFAKKYVRIEEDGTKVFTSSPCVFLGGDNRCTVYEDRPRACQDFPYLHEDGFRQRTLMMIENTSVCPIVFNVWQLLKAALWKRPRPPRKRSRRF